MQGFSLPRRCWGIGARSSGTHTSLWLATTAVRYVLGFTSVLQSI